MTRSITQQDPEWVPFGMAEATPEHLRPMTPRDRDPAVWAAAYAAEYRGQHEALRLAGVDVLTPHAPACGIDVDRCRAIADAAVLALHPSEVPEQPGDECPPSCTNPDPDHLHPALREQRLAREAAEQPRVMTLCPASVLLDGRLQCACCSNSYALDTVAPLCGHPAVALLRELEWCRRNNACPVCFEEKLDGHASGCKLAIGLMAGHPR